MTHNTGECHKYEKDGTLKKSFNGKAAIGPKHHGNGKKDHTNSFMQFMECFSKLDKAVKKTQKSSRKKKLIKNSATLVIPTQNRIMGTVVL